MSKTEICCGCKGAFRPIEGPIHRYMTSSPACWKVYGNILEREYSNQDYFSVHRLTVDTYAIQHQGVPSRETINSVAVHLLSLYAIFTLSSSFQQATEVIKKATRSKELFTWLVPPMYVGNITVLDVQKAANSSEHVKLVSNWAEESWHAWSNHHETVANWYKQIW